MARLPITERVHPAGAGLEALPARRVVARLHQGDAEATRAVGRALPALARLADAVAAALARGGRLVYAGAGTSGRLGALDAAECPPTFGTRPSQVVALVAGGRRALTRAVEGAEDDAAAGARDVRRLGVGARDVVVGISASGRTPYVRGALAEAKKRGAATGLVTSDPASPIGAGHRVVLDTGPERVAGSTRMKAGTAAKMALGIVSSTAMIRLGKVRGGRMLDMTPTNAKLRERAVRSVSELGGVSAARARALLGRAGWSVRGALDSIGG